MAEKKFHRNNEFCITVSYKKRSQQYRVKHDPLNSEEEKFSIITNNRTVVLTSKRQPSCSTLSVDQKQAYFYDDHEITNKCLMKRIIEAIDKHMSVIVSPTQSSRHQNKLLMS
jgi:hypothetical protein